MTGTAPTLTLFAAPRGGAKCPSGGRAGTYDRSPVHRGARTLAAVASALFAATLMGCATTAPPQPWEKGVLARPEMQFDADPLDTKITQHIYTSKEAATGGFGAGGGGCGCN